jgi:hypothetical protein
VRLLCMVCGFGARRCTGSLPGLETSNGEGPRNEAGRIAPIGGVRELGSYPVSGHGSRPAVKLDEPGNESEEHGCVSCGEGYSV